MNPLEVFIQMKSLHAYHLGRVNYYQVINISVKYSSFSQNCVKNAKGGARYMKLSQAFLVVIVVCIPAPPLSDNVADRGGACKHHAAIFHLLLPHLRTIQQAQMVVPCMLRK